MSKDNEGFDEVKWKSIVKFAPKSGPERDTYFAGILQRDVIQEEKDKLRNGLDKYDEATVNQAIVHTRQDMVLVYDMLSNNNKLLHSINKLLKRFTQLLSFFVGIFLISLSLLIWSF